MSIVKFKKSGEFEVLAFGGNAHLGGVDFDQRLVEYFSESFTKENGKQLSAEGILQLRTACQLTKCLLADNEEADLQPPGPIDGVNFCPSITRTKFDELVEDLYELTVIEVDRAMQDAGLNKEKIDHVVLVGGSSRMLGLQETLAHHLGINLHDFKQDINPDEVVARGAAIQAAKLAGSSSEEIDRYLLTDKIRMTLGIRAVDETGQPRMASVIPRNAKIPAVQSREFHTVREDQDTVEIVVYEGESRLLEENNKLGSFYLTGISPSTNGEMKKIPVTFKVKADGILQVKAQHPDSDQTEGITITNSSVRMTDEQFQELVLKKKAEREIKAIEERKIKAKAELEKKIKLVRRQVNVPDDLQERKELGVALKNVEDWLGDNDDVQEAFEYEQRQQELDEALDLFKLQAPNSVRKRKRSDDDNDTEVVLDD